MKLTIDTAHDSHDDIRKVIKMLQHLVGDSSPSYSNQGNIFDDSSSNSGLGNGSGSGSESDPGSGDSGDGVGAFGAMFGDDSNLGSSELGDDNVEEKEKSDDHEETVELMPY